MKKTIFLTALAAIAIQISVAGTITGVVTDDSTGLPIEGVWVEAYNYATGQYRSGGDTNSDGFYVISNLAAGTYRLEAIGWNAGYVGEYYDNVSSYEDAAPVSVASPGVTQNINFSLATGGYIRGTVVDPNGLPVEDVGVFVYEYSTNQYCGNVFTDSAGNYSLGGLTAGTYLIMAVPGNNSIYGSQYYNGRNNMFEATPVVLSANEVLEGINFQLVLGGGISGTVTNSDGQPIANMQISVWGSYHSQDFSDWTDASGKYKVGGLSDGQYQITVWSNDTIYASELYDNQVVWGEPTQVGVSVGQWTAGIDFSLDLGASISGIVKNASGVGQANVSVYWYVDDQWRFGSQTNTDGYYEFNGLPVGYTATVAAEPPTGSSYNTASITVDIDQPGQYTNKDIIFFEASSLTISGRITDKATTLPLVNIRVGCWNDDFEIWTETRTNTNGIYILTNLQPGEVDIQVQPESYYAYMGVNELQLQANISNLDFALPAGAALCGKIIDAQTAQPLAGIAMEYSNDSHATWRDLVTDADGAFCLTQLPPGIAELKVRPAVDSGYAWNLPDGGDFVCMDEGENRSGRMITLEQGALVGGYMKDAAGNPLGGFEYYYSGRDSDGGSVTDINGFYQMRLPVGTYFITVDDNGEFGALPAIVTVTDINANINVPDITVFTEVTGGQISGQISNPGSYAKMGVFTIVAFKAGTLLNDSDLWYTAQPAVVMGMENAGPFTLDKLPSGANYDLYLCVDYETPDIESLAIRDSMLNVAAGTTGITLEYNSQGGTVTGAVTNTDGLPVLGVTVILWGSSGFSGFTQTDCGGQYVFYNVPAGTYTATAIRSKYHVASTSLEVADGVTADADDMVMSFEGNKEGPDLNGDGKVDMGDLAEFAVQWLHSGISPADFNQDNQVNLYDWSRIAENWLSKAIWYHE